MTDQSHRTRHPDPGQPLFGRRRLMGASALAAAGWVAGAGGWMLAPKSGPRRRAADQDGHRHRHHRRDRAVGQRQLAGRAVHGRADQQGGRHPRPADRALPRGHRVRSQGRRRQRPQADPGAQGRRRAGRHHRAMRQAIKDPIVNRGRTLYIYPQLYEGQECTQAPLLHRPDAGAAVRQADPLSHQDAGQEALRHALGQLRLAAAAEQVRPQGRSRPTAARWCSRSTIRSTRPSTPPPSARSATARSIACSTPSSRPACSPSSSSSTNSGFQKNGGVLTCVYYDENLLNYHPAQEMEGLYSCLDYFQAVDDPFSKQLQADYTKKFPDTKYLFTAGSRGDRHVSRHQVLRGRGQGDQRRARARGGGGGAWTRRRSSRGPGGGAEMVPGKMHCKMNMYIAAVQSRRRQDPLRGHREATSMVDPKEC